MKNIIAAFILICISAIGGEIKDYAVLNEDGTRVSYWTRADKDVVESYRIDKDKSQKVALYRELVDVDSPSVTIAHKVIEVGWEFTDKCIFRSYKVVDVDEFEMSAIKSVQQASIAEKLDSIMREGHWEGSIRIDMLQTQILGLMAKAMQAANLHTNLTIQERARFVEIRSNLVSALAIWDAAKSLRTMVSTNRTLYDVSKATWPTNRVTAE